MYTLTKLLQKLLGKPNARKVCKNRNHTSHIMAQHKRLRVNHYIKGSYLTYFTNCNNA